MTRKVSISMKTLQRPLYPGLVHSVTFLVSVFIACVCMCTLTYDLIYRLSTGHLCSHVNREEESEPTLFLAHSSSSLPSCWSYFCVSWVMPLYAHAYLLRNTSLPGEVGVAIRLQALNAPASSPPKVLKAGEPSRSLKDSFFLWRIDNFTSMCLSIDHSVPFLLVHSVLFLSVGSSCLLFLESFLKLYLKAVFCSSFAASAPGIHLWTRQSQVLMVLSVWPSFL